MAIPFLAVWNLATCSKHKALYITQVNQSWILFKQKAFNATGEDHFLELKVSSPACMLPIFAKAACCLELFGCCCRRLSQHGVAEVLTPLRHCWRDAFFCVCVGSGSFCHDWASHCSVLFWSLDALFVFGFPPSPP